MACNMLQLWHEDCRLLFQAGKSHQLQRKPTFTSRDLSRRPSRPAAAMDKLLRFKPPSPLSGSLFSASQYADQASKSMPAGEDAKVMQGLAAPSHNSAASESADLSTVHEEGSDLEDGQQCDTDEETEVAGVRWTDDAVDFLQPSTALSPQEEQRLHIRDRWEPQEAVELKGRAVWVIGSSYRQAADHDQSL